MKKCCKNCKWYIEKQGCYAHSLICSPICLGFEIEKENNCERFEERRTETEAEIKREFFTRPFIVDKTVKLLSDNALKFFVGSGF